MRKGNTNLTMQWVSMDDVPLSKPSLWEIGHWLRVAKITFEAMDSLLL